VARFVGRNAISQEVNHSGGFLSYLNSRGQEALVRIRIRTHVQGFVDGVSLSHLVPGVIYDVDPSLGGYLVSTGGADAVPLSSADIAIPLTPQDFGKALGGVRVTQIAETGDKPERKRAAGRKKR
jgi:hypothetical protein